jgi:hypothetical protein
MPDVLNALEAFVAEHQRCGDLDGGKAGGYVGIAWSCGARIVSRLARFSQHRHEISLQRSAIG